MRMNTWNVFWAVDESRKVSPWAHFINDFSFHWAMFPINNVTILVLCLFLLFVSLLCKLHVIWMMDCLGTFSYGSLMKMRSIICYVDFEVNLAYCICHLRPLPILEDKIVPPDVMARTLYWEVWLILIDGSCNAIWSWKHHTQLLCQNLRIAQKMSRYPKIWAIQEFSKYLIDFLLMFSTLW